MAAITRTTSFGLLLSAVLCLPTSAAVAAPYQKYLNGTCGNGTVCNIYFPVVPPGKRLEIRNFSCYLRQGADAHLFSMQLLVIAANGNVALGVTMVPQYVDFVGPDQDMVWSANHSGFAFANAGQYFRAYAQLEKGPFKQFACHISGEMLPAR